MRNKTINLLESVQRNSIANTVDKVAEQFKSEIIEEYKASETKEMSTELENKITKALALEGVDSPEDWVADVCSVALDMTPTGEALAIKEDENTNTKGQLKQLGIRSIDDIINDLIHKEDTFRYQMLSRLQMDCDYFLGNGNRADKHLWAGNVPDHIKIMRALYNSFSDDKKPEWISMEDIDNYEKEMTDTLKESAALDKIGNAIKEDENTDIKGQLKQLGIKSIYVSDEHKRADEDELNKLGGLEYNYRLQRNSSKAHYYSYLSINHETLGDIYISFDTKTNKIDTTGFPWNFIEKAMTPEIKEFVETNEEFFNNLLKSKELSTGINLNESAILDKIGNIIPEGYKEYMLSNDFTAKTFNSKEKLLKDLKSYNITSFKDAVNNTLTINCKDMYGHRFKTIITWKHLDNKVQESEKKDIKNKADREKRPLTESVDWSYFDKFNDITSKYMPDRGEGETLASQIVTAINKLIYKWYNDGDVYDNVNSGMRGWANDLSSYANWLDKYCKPASKILDSIYNCNNDSEYENILKALADKCLTEEYLSTMEQPKQGSIYDCDGQYEFKEQYDDEEEY